MKRLTEFDTTELQDPSFSQAVIDWQKAHGRHALPWQNTRDAYRIWLSEIMLQQTQVAAVLGYYARFLERFPTVQALAEAPLDDVMAHWSGLGYYTRARNLHACARRVVADYGGVFPSDPALLAELPGIGRSTAAAIAAFSSGARAAILDGNVKRVFARVFGVDQYPGIKPVEDALWKRADALLPEGDGIEAYTQGLMDLGATLCTRGKPDCGRCPLQARCVAHATDRTAVLPVPKPKKATPEKRALMLAVVDAGQVLLQQRPESGIWGGLLSLPEFDGHVALDEADVVDITTLANAAGEFGDVAELEPLLPLVHGFTHYKLHIQPYRIALAKRADPNCAPAGHVWWDLARISEAPLPAPIKKLLEQLGQPTLFA
jgi:A/G-specific adenine glycosylase